LLEINVGTQDTAADETLTKKMALKIYFYPLVICARKNWIEIKTDSFQQTIVLKTQKHGKKYS
jgi:hypothetical protein